MIAGARWPARRDPASQFDLPNATGPDSDFRRWVVIDGQLRHHRGSGLTGPTSETVVDAFLVAELSGTWPRWRVATAAKPLLPALIVAAVDAVGIRHQFSCALRVPISLQRGEVAQAFSAISLR